MNYLLFLEIVFGGRAKANPIGGIGGSKSGFTYIETYSSFVTGISLHLLSLIVSLASSFNSLEFSFCSIF